MKCQHEFVDCTCPDKEDRAAELVKSRFIITRVCLKCGKHYATCQCEEPVWTTSEDPKYRELLGRQAYAHKIMRLVDSRGVEKEFDFTHIGYYVWLPGSLRQKIADVIRVPVYSVGREITGPITNRTNGNRIFIQTGERDGTYLLTFELMPEDLCEKVRAILDAPITDALREESNADYHRNVEMLDHHQDLPVSQPKENNEKG
jgi:hypothetical protein